MVNGLLKGLTDREIAVEVGIKGKNPAKTVQNIIHQIGEQWEIDGKRFIPRIRLAYLFHQLVGSHGIRCSCLGLHIR